MRCVSYTRTMSCRYGDVPSADIISKQNIKIQNYAREHGWKIEEKYSDRKKSTDANEAFLKLLDDGINRRFDMVIVKSLDRCGENICRAEDVLVKTFYPAGIQFTVVDDDFSSIGKSGEEVAEYLKRSRQLLYAGNLRDEMRDRVRDGILSVHDEKYGYLLTADQRGLVIDEEVAGIVKEVFQLIVDGYGFHNISKLMNERKLESPMAHLSRVSKKGWKANDVKWSDCSVKRIVSNPVYTGYWKKKIDGKEQILYVEPIIEKEVFDKAQAVIASRRTTKGNHKVKFGILAKKIFDKKNGATLFLRNFKECSVFLKNGQLGIIPKNPKRYIPQEDVLQKVKEAIAHEMKLADYVYKLVSSEMSLKKLEECKQELSKEAQVVFWKESTLMEQRVPLYCDLQAGKINLNQYEAKKISLRESLTEYEREFVKIEEAVKKVKIIYSSHNPWVNAFAHKTVPEVLNRKDIDKWIEKVFVEDLKTVEVVLMFQEWKNELPEEWLLEAERSVRHGQKE